MTQALDQLSAAATQGEWIADTIQSEGSYGSGDDTHEGFATTAIYDASGKVLFDTLNSDAILVQDEWDEDGFHHAYDLTSAANAAFIVALVNAYRTGQLVAVSDDAIERVARAIQGSYNASDPSEILSWSAISEHERNLYRRDAKAAIAAMKDTQPALAAKGTGDE